MGLKKGPYGQTKSVLGMLDFFSVVGCLSKHENGEFCKKVNVNKVGLENDHLHEFG